MLTTFALYMIKRTLNWFYCATELGFSKDTGAKEVILLLLLKRRESANCGDLCKLLTLYDRYPVTKTVHGHI